jgi:hypothetical protein
MAQQLTSLAQLVGLVHIPKALSYLHDTSASFID